MLTDAGLAKLRQARDDALPQIDVHFGRGLTPDEQALLVELLGKLAGAGVEVPCDPDA